MRLHLPQLLLLALLVAAPSARAHRLSDACLWIEVAPDGIHGRLDVPLRDLADLLPLDANGDGAVTWRELRNLRPALQDLVHRTLRLSSSKHGDLALDIVDLQVADLAGEPCASMPLRAFPAPTSGARLELDYRLLAAEDPQHRGLLRWQQGDRFETAVLGPNRPTAAFTCDGIQTDRVASPAAWPGFLSEGVHHIWTGFDHLLFLLALLLPAVAPRHGGEARTSDSLAATLVRVLKVVTAFTIAHSITLLLAALHLVRLPSAPVEIAIAASVAVAALNNLVPLLRERTAWVAFAFGLIHGFGFAGVLEDLQLPRARFVQAVLGFNLGVELGQLVIVAAFLPLAFTLRRSWVYRRVALPLGSIGILLIALFWMGQRSLAAGAAGSITRTPSAIVSGPTLRP